ncbi:MCM3-associated protein [Echinococcus granulosus]|uniref:MCM3-associated protein n=1 Tax=Echinococcus granulosus TaxID=6210 RepID=W6UTE3_ECHGR|nr:MCM3-associated protein [Echinococcus granulosus]EUB64915.1 MCM3-associated protein [Echinococcus granulosus]
MNPQSRAPSVLSFGRMHEGAGLFGNLSGSLVQKSLFPPKSSALSHCLFGFSFNASKTKTDNNVSPSEPTFEVEQRVSSNADRLPSEKSSERNFYSGLWVSSGNGMQQTGLFSTSTTQAPAKDVLVSQNLSFGIKKPLDLPNIPPESLNLLTKRSDLGIFQLPNKFYQTACSSNKKQASQTEQVEQQISHSTTPMMAKLNCVSLGQNQEIAAQKAKLVAEGLIPGFAEPYEECSYRKNEPTSSLPFQDSTSPPSFFSNNAMKDTAGPGTGAALTVQERLAVLEASDKAEHERRQSTCSHPDLTNKLPSNQSIIVGTCPDMCPETERYLRELRQRVSVFECQSGGSSSAPWQMDHTRAVKDYSRSAADQAEPLPWELRPPEVLQRTMNYLLSAIADRPEIDTTGNLWKPWYEFLWTRTRAIRKDITQQRLCSPAIVSIVEKITRFHIFCAARLVDQSMDAFDPRINSENLTQCLQTLKELYGDLQGAPADLCPCEPEFRAYMILMKLNDCSVLDEVQKFPDALRKSKEVQFAIAVHSAVAEHNHVRFFRLVRAADCLTACLLHRYFSQVRSHALLALSAAFCRHPRHEVTFPLATFVNQLGFESRKDAQAFCEHWNLHVSGDNLIFKRHSLPREPELAWQERRAFNLIEGKRLGRSLADLFNGGPIDPSYAKPGPVHSSFDSGGHLLSVQEIQESPYYPSLSTLTGLSLSMDKLKSSSVLAGGTNTGDSSNLHLEQPAFKLDSMFVGPSEPIFSDEAKSEASMAIFNEVLNGEIRRVLTMDLRETKAAESMADELIEETIKSNLTQIVEEEITLRLGFLSSLVEEIAESIIRTFVNNSLREVVSDVISESVVSAISGDILMEALSEFALRVLKKTRSEHLNMRRLLKRTFSSWKAICLEEQRRDVPTRDFIRSIPAAPPPHLWLGDFSVEELCSPRRAWLRAFPERENYALKRARLCSSSSAVSLRPCRATRGMTHRLTDANLAYRPLGPIHGLSHEACIGVIVSTAAHFFSRWLCNKLRNHTNFTLLPSVDYLTGTEVGLIVIGDGPSHLEIPQLRLLPSELGKSAEHSDTVESIVFPPPIDGNATMAYCWNTLLQTGLQWLVKKVAVVSGDGDGSGGTMAKTENSATLQPLFPQSSTLVELVSSRVQAAFLTPLLVLIGHWTEQGLTHPDPHYLLTAYNQILDPLPRSICTSLVISPLPEPLPPNISWHEAVDRWHSFLLTLRFPENLAASCELSPNFCERWRRVSALLIPWGPLCIRLVRARLDTVLDDDGQSVSASTTIEVVPAAARALDQLGPQFSVASIVREFKFRPPKVQPADGDWQPREPSASSDAVAQQLQELDAKIAKLSNDVRLILK